MTFPLTHWLSLLGRFAILMGVTLLLLWITDLPPRSWIAFGMLLAHPSHTSSGILALLGLQSLGSFLAYLLLLLLFFTEGKMLWQQTRAHAPKASSPPLTPSPSMPPPVPVPSPPEETQATLPLTLLLPNPYGSAEPEQDELPPPPAPALRVPPPEAEQTSSEQEARRAPAPLLAQEAAPSSSEAAEAAPVEAPPLLSPLLPILQHQSRTSEEQAEAAPSSPPEASFPSPDTPEKRTPLERLEAFYREQRAAGIPLEELTVDAVRQHTHVKRDTVSKFLREKKAEATQQALLPPTPPDEVPTHAPAPAPAPSLPKAPPLEAAYRSDPGLKRAHDPNEDSTLVHLEGTRGLFAVADGMGGHGHGQQASQQALACLQASLHPYLSQASPDACRTALIESVQQANRELYDTNQEQETDMGTTLTAALVVDAVAYIVNIGDSRTYWQSRQHGLVQVTRDHSTVQTLIEQRVIPPEQRYTHPKRHEIYRCLGLQAEVSPDAFVVRLEPGDRLLLCSDGLWEMLPNAEQLARLMAQDRPLVTICDDLLEAALAGGGADNVTILLVQAPTPSDMQQASNRRVS